MILNDGTSAAYLLSFLSVAAALARVLGGRWRFRRICDEVLVVLPVQHLLLVLVDQVVAVGQFLLDVSHIAALIVACSWRGCDVHTTILRLTRPTHGSTHVKLASHRAIASKTILRGVSTHEVYRHDDDLVVDHGSEHQQEKGEQLTPVEHLLSCSQTDDPDEQGTACVNS